MESIKTKRDKIIELIKNDDLVELKKFIKEPNFKLYNLNAKYKCEILISSIKSNASFPVIKFIIDQWNKEINHYLYIKQCTLQDKYKNENYYGEDNNLENTDTTVQHELHIESPLSVAIQYNHFKVADYLQEKGSILNDIPKFTLLSIINNNNFIYLLNKNIPISHDFFIDLIKSLKIDCIENIFHYYSFNTTIILNLLLMYKKGIKTSDSDLKNMVRDENLKISWDESIYREAFSLYFSYDDFLKNNDFQKDYRLLKILYDHDPRESEVKELDIYRALRNFYLDQKLEFLNSIKNPQSKSESKSEISWDPHFVALLEQSIDYQKIEDHMISLVQNNQLSDLQNYMKDHHIVLTDLPGEYHHQGHCYYELLTRALWNENESIIKFLIDHGADINHPDDSEKSPLHLQLSISQILKDGQDIHLVQKLIEWGADINKVWDGETPLIKAIQMNHIPLVKYMIEKGAQVNQIVPSSEGTNTALGMAIYLKNLEMVKLLIQYGADVNQATYHSEMPLTLAIHPEHSHPLPDSKNSKDSEGNFTRFNQYKNKYKQFRFRHNIGSNNNINKDKEMINFLIKHGLNIHSPKINLYKNNHNNNNNNKNKYYWESGPIGYALRHDNIEMVHYLLDCGVKADIKDLISAIEGNHREMVQYLIEVEGVNVNQAVQYYGEEGITPLHVAIQENNQALVEYLVEKAGAQVILEDTENPCQKSHLNTAIMTGNVNLVNYIIQWALVHSEDHHSSSHPTSSFDMSKAYDTNEKYNLNDDNESSFLPITYLLDSYVEHFK